MRQPVKQIAYKGFINVAKKLNFRTEYNASADTLVALCLIIGKYKIAVISIVLK